MKATVGRSRHAGSKDSGRENLPGAQNGFNSVHVQQRTRTIVASGELSWDEADEIMHLE